jgi:secondary thiamine-phosphate synthase enzyme
MPVLTKSVKVRTDGFTDVVDLTGLVAAELNASGLQAGTLTVFVPGSTAGLTTIEYESGLVRDLQEAFERLAPQDRTYHHDARWGDGNGFSHVRASLLGGSLSIPFVGGRLLLGTWQQLVLVDFDNRPRSREILLQLVGE